MSNQFSIEPMLDMFIFETTQLLEQLEHNVLTSEKSNGYSEETIHEIFRIMHTIKGSSAMMMFNHISLLAHSMEDLFFFFREEKPLQMDCATLSDMVLEGVDFIKIEIEKIKSGDPVNGDASELIQRIKGHLSQLKQGGEPLVNRPETGTQNQQYYISQEKVAPPAHNHTFKAVLRFEEGCEMENIRAYTVIHNLKDLTQEIFFFPEDIIDNDQSAEIIRHEGFTIYFKASEGYDELRHFFLETIFLKELELKELENDEEFKQLSEPVKTSRDLGVKIPVIKEQLAENKEPTEKQQESQQHGTAQQSIVSVNVSKLDKLMDLVGEMVIAEAMVIQNPDLKGLELDNFQKAAQRLSKITNEIQDMVMSVRMVSLSTTFHKMHRIVRDMCKKLGKEVDLKIIGEETEVDKNIIEHISDPLMHLVRNALDHGIESSEERRLAGKPEAGTITLEAKNAGGDVLVLVKDNGKGLNKEKILKKAVENGILAKQASEMTDKEIYNLIFLPGFSTKEKVTEFSGRGVGMDVVTKNIEAIGGSVSVDSVLGKGSTITLKIPLTLAIIDGMTIRVGKASYTMPTVSIKESFRPRDEEIITDPDGNEMIMVRGQCYPILRLHKLFKIKDAATRFSEGIIIMVEQDGGAVCCFADELIGQQQVVVKALPEYIRRFKKMQGIAGCTLLGDGGISLILDIGGLVKIYKTRTAS